MERIIRRRIKDLQARRAEYRPSSKPTSTNTTLAKEVLEHKMLACEELGRTNYDTKL